MKFPTVCLALIFCLPFCGYAEEEGIDLTVYNQNFALVRERRTMEFEKGVSQVRFQDVAALIEPPSVHFKSLTDPQGCVIQEQNYEYDLVSAEKLLSKYIDKKIKVLTEGGGVYDGKLMSYDGADIVLQNSKDQSLNMIHRGDNVKNIDFTELPEGLITRPTLMWQVANDRAGKHLTEVSYLTNGVTWMCDYVAVVDKDDKAIDLAGWVTINNQSGAAYQDAKVKLIAGDVHRIADTGPRYAQMMKPNVMREAAAAPQFQEKSFFEYHMYTLQRKSTVKSNQTKQITLLDAADVAVNKLYIYDPSLYGWGYYQDGQTTKEQKVNVKIEITNSEQAHLGMPLPKGKVRVYKKDSDGGAEFIGEDLIDHTPKDEKIRLDIGNAFDLVGERKRIDFKQYGKTADETIEISLRNHKEEDVEIIVVEHLWRYINWEMTAKTHAYVQKDAQTVEFKVAVPKNGETKLKYTVHYWWA